MLWACVKFFILRCEGSVLFHILRWHAGVGWGKDKNFPLSGNFSKIYQAVSLTKIARAKKAEARPKAEPELRQVKVCGLGMRF